MIPAVVPACNKTAENAENAQRKRISASSAPSTVQIPSQLSNNEKRNHTKKALEGLAVHRITQKCENAKGSIYVRVLSVVSLREGLTPECRRARGRRGR